MSVSSCVEEYFHSDDWKYEELSEGVYRSGIRTNEGTYRIIHHAKDEDQRLIVMVFVESCVAERSRQSALEYLMRATYNMVLGNFEMDMDDGEVRFRISADFNHGGLSAEAIAHMTYVAIAMMDRHYLGLMGVCFGGKTPEEAIAEIE